MQEDNLVASKNPGIALPVADALTEVLRRGAGTLLQQAVEAYVYIWADGIYFGVRLEDARQCILVIIGANSEGKKELLGIADGYRESEESWKELLLDLKQRGLSIEPKLATGEGGLGFWKALPQIFGSTRAQRCWKHKTANVLNKTTAGIASES